MDRSMFDQEMSKGFWFSTTTSMCIVMTLKNIFGNTTEIATPLWIDRDSILVDKTLRPAYNTD